MKDGYEKEWNRLLEDSRELIEKIIQEKKKTEELKKCILERDKEKTLQQKKEWDYKKGEVEQWYHIMYHKLIMFKDISLNIAYQPETWRENAILFVIANAPQEGKKQREPIWIEPRKIFSKEGLEMFFSEIKRKIGTEQYEKYESYMRCGFVLYSEKDYLKDIILHE